MRKPRHGKSGKGKRSGHGPHKGGGQDGGQGSRFGKGRGGKPNRGSSQEGGGGGHRSRGPKGIFRHQGSKYLQGRVQKNPQGFAFIISKDPTTEDAYVGRFEARLLLSGDLVEYRLHRQGRRVSAEILNILERTQTEILGVFKKASRHSYVETSQGDVYGVVGDYHSIASEQWVIAKIKEYPTQRTPALVIIEECLGKDLGPEHDNRIAVAKFGIPDVFSMAVLRDADNSRQWGMEELKSPQVERKDLRSLPFITVDGEDAKDFDDAILVTEGAQGGYKLYVAIADVSFFVRPKTELDKSAFERSTSVYLPGTCIPMLPETLSNDLCSLRPQTDKLTLTAEIEYDRAGTVLDAHFYESIICTARRVTYNELHAFYEKQPEQVQAFKALERPLQLALSLYQILTKRRAERGVLDFELPECQMELGPDLIPKGMFRRPRFESHRLIEEFMIAANSEVAKVLRVGKASALYRVHETPDHEKIEAVNALMRRLGFSEMLKETTPKAFSKVLAATLGKKGAHTLHQAILRSQKQARYEPDPRGHFGLALMDYTHFTSPIRRYPDLVVHRALKEFIIKVPSSDKSSEGVDFIALGEKTSERERRAMEAERFVTRRKQCWFFQKRVGDSFDGIISGVIQKGLFIEIPEFGTEGFLPVETMAGYYEYDESRLCFRKRPGHTTLSLGDPLKITVEMVEVEQGKITFSQADPEDLSDNENESESDDKENDE